MNSQLIIALLILLSSLVSNNNVVNNITHNNFNNNNFNNNLNNLINENNNISNQIINQSNEFIYTQDRENISENFNEENQQNISNNQSDYNDGDFEVAGGNSSSSIYYLRVILEGIERERATSVPPQYLDGNLYCDNQLRGGIRGRNVYSYDITQITISNDCNNPSVLLQVRHWLNLRTNLTSTSQNNPQEITFKAGDVDGNDLVDDADVLTILFNHNQDWNYSTSTTERPDLNLDGIVDDRDLSLALNNFGLKGDQ
ncbi:MAG: hypothetical protein KatS3mg094_249 [Candidatus Parcubacteria bacterium]|nr:MAG: hypothetical protein KatS3mg094_249 [Candidatus Parcubacteria bacterium]